jgi:cytochrome c-type biogenesis protein CcmH
MYSTPALITGFFAALACALLVVWSLRRGAQRVALAALVAWPVATAVAVGIADTVTSKLGASQSSPAGRSAALPEEKSAAAQLGGGTGSADDALMRGRQMRIERRFAEARDAFREAVAARPGDADAWADLADASAAAAGNDLRAGREAIERALAVDPEHPKALWLRASLELQEQQYEQAAATWEHLARLVPPDSSDARVIAANIDEARRLAKSAPAGAGPGR